MSHTPELDDPEARRLAAAYVGNADNRGVFERVTSLTEAAPRLAGRTSAVDLLLSPEYRDHIARDLATVADEWEPELATPVRRVLDAGCGPGLSTLALAERYVDAEVVGVDVEEASLDFARHLARENPRCSFKREPLEQLEEGAPFDVIQCRTVLEHVYDPRRVIAVLLRHLAPGGVLYVETPNYVYPWEPHLRLPMLPKSPKGLLRLQCRLTGRDPGFVAHLNFTCDPVTIRRWARKAAPEVVVHDLMARKAARVFMADEPVRVASRGRIVGLVRLIPGGARAAVWALAHLPIAPSVALLFVRPRGALAAD